MYNHIQCVLVRRQELQRLNSLSSDVRLLLVGSRSGCGLCCVEFGYICTYEWRRDWERSEWRAHCNISKCGHDLVIEWVFQCHWMVRVSFIPMWISFIVATASPTPISLPPPLQVHLTECELYPIVCESCGKTDIARKCVSEGSPLPAPWGCMHDVTCMVE